MSQIPGMTEENFQHKNLIVDEPTRHISVEIPSGEGLVKEGQLLGKRALGAGTPAAGGGNTGDGTVSNFALKKYSIKGNYSIVFIDANNYKVFDPQGKRLADGVVGTTYDTDQLTFDVTAGGTAFAADDTFSLPVEDGDGKRVKLDSTAVDGSQWLEGVLNCDVDATSADKRGDLIVEGTINSDAIEGLTASGYSLAELKEMSPKGLYFEDSIN